MYYKEGIISIYQVIGNRYGKSVQETASIAFLITRIFADGIRFLATAGIVRVITGQLRYFYNNYWCHYDLLFRWRYETILWIDGFQFLFI